MSLNASLINLVQYMEEQMAAFPDLLPSEMLDASGKADDWTAKDNFFHALVWAQRRLEILETLERGEVWEDVDYGDFEDANREIYNKYKDQTWGDARKMANETYQGVLAYLKRISEETLLDSKEGEERTFWRSIVDNYISHPMIHLWEQLANAGKIDTIASMFGENFFKLMLGVDDSEAFQGGVYYNQSCLLALSGEKEKAVKVLGKALNMVPALKEWSTQDSDLDSLRDLPAFQLLYTEE